MSDTPEGFDGLIRALTIFRTYGEVRRPTHCEHDVMYVCVEPGSITDEDLERLEELGFTPSHEDGMEDCFKSFRYGSA